MREVAGDFIDAGTIRLFVTNTLSLEVFEEVKNNKILTET